MPSSPTGGCKCDYARLASARSVTGAFLRRRSNRLRQVAVAVFHFPVTSRAQPQAQTRVTHRARTFSARSRIARAIIRPNGIGTPFPTTRYFKARDQPGNSKSGGNPCKVQNVDQSRRSLRDPSTARHAGAVTAEFRPLRRDSLSAPMGHRSFLLCPPLRVSSKGLPAKRFPVSFVF